MRGEWPFSIRILTNSATLTNRVHAYETAQAVVEPVPFFGRRLRLAVKRGQLAVKRGRGGRQNGLSLLPKPRRGEIRQRFEKDA